MTASNNDQRAPVPPVDARKHNLNDINFRPEGEMNRPSWLRMAEGADRRHAYALWLLAELEARKAAASVINAQRHIMIQRGFLRVEKQTGQSLF